MQAEGQVREVLLLDGLSSVHVHCDEGLIPVPGQYVLAYAAGSDAVLATPLFAFNHLHGGFVAAPPTPSTWNPGTRLLMRGPLGSGFRLPASCRRIALVAFHCSARTLLSLLEPAFRQDASVTVVGNQIPDDLPLQVEAQPLHALGGICQWADFIAVDVQREQLPELRQILEPQHSNMKADGQILIRTPMPCGALAACGVCTVEMRGKRWLACEDGPVFDVRQALEWSRMA